MGKPSNAALLSAISETLAAQNAAMTKGFASLNERLTILETASQPYADAAPIINTERIVSKAARAPKNAAPKNAAPKDAPVVKYSNAGGPNVSVTGTVVRVSKTGYSVLVDDATSGPVWVNCRKTGKGNKPLFRKLEAGASFTGTTYNEWGYVTAETFKAGAPKGKASPSRMTPPIKTTTTETVALAAAAPKPAAVVKASAPKATRGGAGCEFCSGPTHGKNSVAIVTQECLSRQYAASGSDLSLADWTNAVPRTVFAHRKAGMLVVGAVPTTAPKATVPKAPASEATILDGQHDVTFVQAKLSKSGNGMVKVHNASLFAGGKSTGTWLDVADRALYGKLAAQSMNTRLRIDVVNGILTGAKRHKTVEQETGVTPGIKGSDAARQTYPTSPPSFQKKDAKVKAARVAARRRRASLRGAA